MLESLALSGHVTDEPAISPMIVIKGRPAAPHRPPPCSNTSIMARTTIPMTTMTQRACQTAFLALAARVRVTLRSPSRSRHSAVPADEQGDDDDDHGCFRCHGLSIG